MILTVFALAAASPAPVDAVTLDLRCLLATSQLGSSEDAAERRAGEGSAFFFFGRVDTRVADSELEERLWQQAVQIDRMSPEDRQALIQACAQLMQQRGQRLMDIGNSIDARENAAARGQ